MTLVSVKTKEEFDAAVQGAARAAVHFWATWCEPCTHMDSVFAQLASENPGEKFLRVEAEELPDISEKYNVTAVPFFLFFKDGAAVDRLEGADPSALALKVTRHVSSPGLASTPAPHPGPSSSGAAATPAVLEEVLTATQKATGVPALTPGLRKRLEILVKSSPVVLFLKGTAEAPRCGFSSKVVGVLEKEGVGFGEVDILSDPEVRAGMKEFSDWPTFPQLYCNGELVGGCDIVMEMAASGELRELFREGGVVPNAGGGEGSGNGAANGEVPGGVGLQERLKKLVESNETMLFMKGSPDAPRCGFSKKVVAALRKEGVEFGSFDILGDEAVRQGMKDFSDWPTFPQLYHGGEFVGGCDIVLEMSGQGELKEALGG